MKEMKRRRLKTGDKSGKREKEEKIKEEINRWDFFFYTSLNKIITIIAVTSLVNLWRYGVFHFSFTVRLREVPSKLSTLSDLVARQHQWLTSDLIDILSSLLRLITFPQVHCTILIDIVLCSYILRWNIVCTSLFLFANRCLRMRFVHSQYRNLQVTDWQNDLLLHFSVKRLTIFMYFCRLILICSKKRKI